VIVVICAIGAYTVHSAMLDIWFMLLFGVVGYVFKKLDYPLAPLVLALVLGDKAEDSFRQAMLVSQGELSSCGPTRWWAAFPRWPCCCCSGR
jgi:putative tricarboxylic transport membrane protein